MSNSDRNSVEDWWATNPMTYGTVHGAAEYGEKKIELGSKEFFKQVDQVFCRWNPNLHATRPFDRLFPYDEYANGGRVLEIGCGMGTMAMNWARNGSKITAVDLNATSIAQTQRRFDLFGLQ